MGLIDDPIASAAAVNPPALPTEDNFPRETVTPGWQEVVAAEFETNNTVGSIAANESGIGSEARNSAFDPDFSLADAIRGTPWANNPGLFVTARNREHFDALVRDHERDERNRRVIEGSSWGQWLPAMIAVQAVDPVNWLSLGTVGALRIAQQGGRGLTLATRTGAIAAGVAADTAVQEGILQATQVNRTVAESLSGIGGSMLLGGLIGHVGSRLLLRTETDALSRMIEEEVRVFEAGERPSGNLTGGGAGVGAQAVRVGDDGPSPRLKFSFGADYLSQRMGPQQRLTHSESDVARRFANEMIETPYFYRENVDGFITAPRGDAMGMPGSVQTRIGSVWEEPIMRSIYGMRELYLEYRGAEHQNFAQRAAFNVAERFGRTGGAMSEVEFRRAVTDAIHNSGEHAVPQVAKAAKHVLAVADLVEASNAKLIADGKRAVLAEGQRAIPRSWLVARITGERPRFRQIMVDWLKYRRNVIEGEWETAQRELKAKSESDASLTADQRTQRDLANARDQAARDAARPESRRYEGLPLTREEVDVVAETWNYIREVQARPTPQSLTDFLVKAGGLQDAGKDVSHLTGGMKGRPGLVSGKGSSLDDAALRAWEAGFFPDHAGRPTIAEFLNRLQEDLQSGRVTRAADQQHWDDVKAADDMARELQDSYGITTGQFNKEHTLREFFGERSGSTQAAEGSGSRQEGSQEPELTAEQQRLRLRASMVDAELEVLADRAIERLTLAREGRTAHDVHTTRDADGFIRDDALLTAEDFNVPYRKVSDFLETDSELLLRLMHRSMIPDIEIAHRFGSVDAAEVLRARMDEGTRAINAAATPAERAKLEKRLKRDLQDMQDARDRLNGRYGVPNDPAAPMVRAGRFLRDASIVQKMGMSAFASIPETARLITARGFSAIFSDLLYPMVRDFAKLAEAGHDLRMATHAMDHYTASRAMAIADGAEDWGSIPKIDRFSREATKTFMRATGLPKLTDWQKSAGGILVSKSILEAAEATKAGTATRKQTELLSRLSISRENATAIAEQFGKHGVRDDARIWAAETNSWDDAARPAREAFLGGVRREVNRLITTPGLDTPNMSQNEVGRIFFQYKGFALSAYERVLVSGLQQNDVAFWSSAVAAVGLAFLVNEGRKAVFQQSGDPRRHKTFEQRWGDPRERNQMFLDAIDRSGVIGWLPEVNTVMDRVFGAGLSTGIGSVPRQPGIARAPDAMRQLAGPALSSGFDTTLYGTKLAARMVGLSRWSETDTRRLESVIPFIGLHWMRLGLEQLGAEGAVNRALGATPSGSRGQR